MTGGLPSGERDTSKDKFSCGKSLAFHERRSGPTMDAPSAGLSIVTIGPVVPLLLKNQAPAARAAIAVTPIAAQSIHDFFPGGSLRVIAGGSGVALFWSARIAPARSPI